MEKSPKGTQKEQEPPEHQFPLVMGHALLVELQSPKQKHLSEMGSKSN